MMINNVRLLFNKNNKMYKYAILYNAKIKSKRNHEKKNLMITFLTRKFLFNI